MVRGGWTGARIYDVLLLRCATKQEVERIYTFNLGNGSYFSVVPPRAVHSESDPSYMRTS